jgi:uncharacterized membrane protein
VKKMPNVEISKVIKAPRTKVWEAISDPETMPKWDVNTKSAKVERWTYYPQERIETETLEGSQVDVKGFQLYEEVPEGTKVTLSYDIGFKGIVGQTLGRLLAGPKLRAFIEETIEGMAKYSEAL